MDPRDQPATASDAAPRPPIRALDDLTISRIAAGEVIESPASVVKELVENALDAGARRIDVAIREGGKRSISVADDGWGIPRADVATAFERHATSKLRSADDLTEIATLGFRGEALAAIASVAHVSMTTRAAGEPTGTRITVTDGRIVDLAPEGAPVGTRITVENLFHAVPARRAFLKGTAAESGRVTEVVARYSFAHPSVQFTLTRDDRQVLAAPGTGDLRDALLATYGHDVARELLALDADHAGVRIEGFAGPPHVQRANRSAITLFINGRLIHDARLTYAVTESYHGLIPARRFPIAVVLASIAPQQVDVNVHPAKTEVRLRDGGAMFSAVQRAVRYAVIGGSPVAPLAGDAAGDRRALWRPVRPSRPEGPMGGVDVRPAGGVREWPATYASGAASSGDDRPAAGAVQPPLVAAPARRALPPLRLLGQLDRAFVLAEGPDGLYLVDQHAAHERIMFERFTARQGPLARQPLLEAQVVAVAAGQLGAAETHAAALEAAGFDVAPFGEGALILRAVPEVLAGEPPAEALRAVLDGLDDGATPVERAAEERVVRAVCKRASVKAGQALSEPEMRALLTDLEACEVPHTCPHGRPTMIVLTRAHLEQRFGR